MGVLNTALCLEMQFHHLLTQHWTKELEGDPDRELLLDGTVHGFQLIPADADLQSAEMDNYLSATNLAVRDKVEATLLEEMAAGNYRVTTEKPVIVSAIGAIPKPDSDELRLIHDCSQPEGRGVNTYADIDSFSS